MVSQTFPPSSRLLSKEDFLGLRSGATKIYGVGLWAYVKKRKEGSGSRIGISVSKKVGNAVHRNYLKRVLRETFRLFSHELGSWDILIVVNPKLFEKVSDKVEAGSSVRKSVLSVFSKIQHSHV